MTEQVEQEAPLAVEEREPEALQQIDLIIEEAEVYLAEALQALRFPEAYGLEDPASRGRALRKLLKDAEVAQEHMRRAREISEQAWVL